MNRKNKLGLILLGIMAMFAVTATFVFADSDYPYGIRTINYIQSSRPDFSNTTRHPIASTYAEAGNVTEMNLTAISTTKSWQGYYGNISGVITLEDSSGYVFYNWSTNEPKGNIFAANTTSINWSGIVCFNWDVIGAQIFSLEDAESYYGMGNDTADGINETFNESLFTNFFVGTRNITEESDAVGATCHATNPYIYDRMKVREYFQNTLLTDGNNLIFSTMIENHYFDNVTDPLGFDDREHDFQMLVAENGHNGFEDTPTLYYFWAELE